MSDNKGVIIKIPEDYINKFNYIKNKLEEAEFFTDNPRLGDIDIISANAIRVMIDEYLFTDTTTISKSMKSLEDKIDLLINSIESLSRLIIILLSKFNINIKKK
ncbi:MAG: hypothetical protein GF317_05990 [Candidatus Lokiarchaeota archaeon]|nr:hypothetical protein [Candidatus Lokiarchaeota archaeon]